MTDRLQHFGYVAVTIARDCLLGPAGTVARGHSVHYSRIEGSPESLACAYRVAHVRNQADEAEGFMRGSVLGSHIHLHFQWNPNVAKAFVQHARG